MKATVKGYKIESGITFNNVGTFKTAKKFETYLKDYCTHLKQYSFDGEGSIMFTVNGADYAIWDYNTCAGYLRNLSSILIINQP
jgi:hypothetical protein